VIQDMRDHAPFAVDRLKEIFRTSAKDPTILITREHSRLEFKASFNLASLCDYARTLAAYANAKGGYIVFGVEAKPHRLAGIKGTKFEDVDPAQISSFLTDHFSPEIKWEHALHEIGNLKFGLIYTHEANRKPVICIRDSGREIKDGAIYYRYRGQTRVIRFAELRQIIDENRMKEQRLWQRLISRIAKVGVRDAAIFDFNTGEVASRGGTFLIDEELLPKLAFVREGQFKQTEGAPAIKIVGKAKFTHGDVIQPARTVTVTRAITIADIVKHFLQEREPDDPTAFFRQLCFENAGYLPFYFFLAKSGKSLVEAKEVITTTVSRARGRQILLKRLQSDPDFAVTLDTSRDKGKARDALRRKILSKKLPPKPSPDEMREYLIVMRALTKRQIRQLKKDYLYPLLDRWFENHYSSAHTSLAQEFRTTLCFIDKLLWADSVRQEPRRSRAPASS
jgi:hypothetical protein